MNDKSKSKTQLILELEACRQEIAELKQASRQQQLGDTLNQTLAAINTMLDLDKVLDTILEHILQVVEHDTANIMLIEDGIARIVRTRGYIERKLDPEHLKETIYFEVNDTPNLRHVVETGQAYIIHDVSSFPSWVKTVYTDWIQSHIAIPILLEEKTIGFLNLDSDTPNFFDEKHIDSLQVFANQAAIAIHNARLFEKVQEQNRVLLTLHRARTKIASSLELEVVLEAISEELAQLLQVECCAISEWNLENDTLPVLFQYDPNGIFKHLDEDVEADYPLDEYFLSKQVLEENQILQYTISKEEIDTAEKAYMERFGLKTVLKIPIVANHVVLGMADIEDSRHERVFTEDEISLAQLLLNQAAAAVENARLFQHLEKAAIELTRMTAVLENEVEERKQSEAAEYKQRILAEALVKTASTISRSLNLDEVLELILEQAEEVIPHDSANIMLVEGGFARIVHARGYTERGVDLEWLKQETYFKIADVADLLEAYETGEPYVIPDVNAYPSWLGTQTTTWVRTHLTIPICTKSQTIGFLKLDSSIPNYFSANDIEILRAFADHAAIAIQNARLFQEAENTAEQLANTIKTLQLEIEEREQAESALRQSEARYRSFVENSLDYIIVLDRDYKIQFVNFVAAGAKKEEIIGQDVLSFIHPDYVETAKTTFDAALVGQKFAHFLVPSMRRDGTVGWFDTRVTPIYEDEHVTGLMLAMADITDLRQAQEEIRRIYDSSNIMLGTAGKDGYFRTLNPAWSKILGYTTDELLAQPSYELAHPDDYFAMLRAMAKLKQDIPVDNYETRYRCKDGTYKWILWSSTAQEETTFFSAQDITERKKMEAALRESEERYRTLVETAPISIFTKDIEGRYTNVNPYTLKYWDKSPIGYRDDELLSPSIAFGLRTADLQVMETGESLTIEEQFEAPNGIRTLLTRKVPLRNSDGDVTGILGTSLDITERKTMEAALRESEEKYRTILENMQEGYYETNMSGEFVFCNRALTNILGYSEDELIGMNYRDVYRDEKALKAVYPIFRTVARTGIPISNFEAEIVRKDGIEQSIESSVALAYTNSGKAIGFRGVSRDVTERKEAQEALQAALSKEKELNAINTFANYVEL